MDGETGEKGSTGQHLNDLIGSRGQSVPVYRSFTYEHQSAIYSSALFRDGEARYGSSGNAEDTTFLLRTCHKTNDIVLQRDAVYFYVQRSGSANLGDGVARTHEEIDALLEKVEFLKGKGIDDNALQYLLIQFRTCLRRYQRLMGADKACRADYDSVAERIEDLLTGVPRREELCELWPPFQELLDGRPLTTPGVRTPGEGEVRVSVILPLFNPGKDVVECIESLRAQLLDGLEFIFVDDCSTDGSMEAVEAWAEKDSRVRILRNEKNIGPGPSRNRGIEAARGAYLSFVDPDDFISPEFCELLYRTAIGDGGHDIAKGLRVEVDGRGCESRIRGNRKNALIVEHAADMPLYLRFKSDHWSALYRRRLFEDGSVRYGLSRKSQDTTFLLRACHRTEDIVLEPRAEYHYRVQREGSAINQRDYQRFEYELDGLDEKVEFLVGEGFDESARTYISEKLSFYITSYYTALADDPLLSDKVEDYTERLSSIVAKTPDPQQALDGSLDLKALVERGELLPTVKYLPVVLRVEGALEWIRFLKENGNLGSGYLDEAAKAGEGAIKQFSNARDREGFIEAYSHIMGAVMRLPMGTRELLLMKVHRRIVTKRNIRLVLKSAGRR